MTLFDLLYLDDIVIGNGLCRKEERANGSWRVWFPEDRSPQHMYRQGKDFDTEEGADDAIANILKRWPIKQVNRLFFIHLLEETSNYFYFPISLENRRAVRAADHLDPYDAEDMKIRKKCGNTKPYNQATQSIITNGPEVLCNENNYTRSDDILFHNKVCIAGISSIHGQSWQNRAVLQKLEPCAQMIFHNKIEVGPFAKKFNLKQHVVAVDTSKIASQKPTLKPEQKRAAARFAEAETRGALLYWAPGMGKTIGSWACIIEYIRVYVNAEGREPNEEDNYAFGVYFLTTANNLAKTKFVAELESWKEVLKMTNWKCVSEWYTESGKPRHAEMIWTFDISFELNKKPIKLYVVTSTYIKFARAVNTNFHNKNNKFRDAFQRPRLYPRVNVLDEIHEMRKTEAKEYKESDEVKSGWIPEGKTSKHTKVIWEAIKGKSFYFPGCSSGDNRNLLLTATPVGNELNHLKNIYECSAYSTQTFDFEKEKDWNLSDGVKPQDVDSAAAAAALTEEVSLVIKKIKEFETTYNFFRSVLSSDAENMPYQDFSCSHVFCLPGATALSTGRVAWGYEENSGTPASVKGLEAYNAQLNGLTFVESIRDPPRQDPETDHEMTREVIGENLLRLEKFEPTAIAEGGDADADADKDDTTVDESVTNPRRPKPGEAKLRHVETGVYYIDYGGRTIVIPYEAPKLNKTDFTADDLVNRIYDYLFLNGEEIYTNRALTRNFEKNKLETQAAASQTNLNAAIYKFARAETPMLVTKKLFQDDAATHLMERDKEKNRRGNYFGNDGINAGGGNDEDDEDDEDYEYDEDDDIEDDANTPADDANTPADEPKQRSLESKNETSRDIKTVIRQKMERLIIVANEAKTKQLEASEIHDNYEILRDVQHMNKEALRPMLKAYSPKYERLLNFLENMAEITSTLRSPVLLFFSRVGHGGGGKKYKYDMGSCHGFEQYVTLRNQEPVAKYHVCHLDKPFVKETYKEIRDILQTYFNLHGEGYQTKENIGENTDENMRQRIRSIIFKHIGARPECAVDPNVHIIFSVSGGKTYADYATCVFDPIYGVYNHPLNRFGDIVRVIAGANLLAQSNDFRNTRYMFSMDNETDLVKLLQQFGRISRSSPKDAFPFYEYGFHKEHFLSADTKPVVHYVSFHDPQLIRANKTRTYTCIERQQLNRWQNLKKRERKYNEVNSQLLKNIPTAEEMFNDGERFTAENWKKWDVSTDSESTDLELFKYLFIL